MILRRPARPAFNATYLCAEDWAREAGISVSTVRRRAEAKEISRHIQDWRCPNAVGRRQPERWMYAVCDLPDDCGSVYLLNYLEREASSQRTELRETTERLERVLRDRRIRGAA